jgi:hypothetical protein
MTFARITVDAAQVGGAPCIPGLRIPVATVVGMLADGMSDAEILEAFPDLEPPISSRLCGTRPTRCASAGCRLPAAA